MVRIVGYAFITILVLALSVLAVVWNIAALPALEVPLSIDRTFANVHIINPGQATLSHQTITVKDGVIESIVPAAKMERRNIARYVMPGLIDVHVHGPRFKPDEELFHTLYLMHGVTTVRNLSDDGRTFELAKSVANGERIGPRMLGCGTPLDGPQGTSISDHYDDPDEAVEAVNALHEAGAACVKVYPTLPPQVFLAIKKRSEELGLPVVGRMNNRLGIEGASMDEVHHLHGVIDVVSPGFRTQDVSGWLKSWKKKFNKERLGLSVRMAQLYKSAHVPSLVGISYLASNKNRKLPKPKLRLMPDWYSDTNGTHYYSLKKSVRKSAKVALPKMMKTVKALHKAGVPILVGTDSPMDNIVPGAAFYDELALLVQAGMSPEDVLASATVVAAQRLGLEDLGYIKEGAAADLLLLSNDPTKDLENLKTLEEVMVLGRSYTSRKLTLHQRKQIKSSRKGLYRYMNDLIPYISDWL